MNIVWLISSFSGQLKYHKNVIFDLGSLMNWILWVYFALGISAIHWWINSKINRLHALNWMMHISYSLDHKGLLCVGGTFLYVESPTKVDSFLWFFVWFFMTCFSKICNLFKNFNSTKIHYCKCAAWLQSSFCLLPPQPHITGAPPWLIVDLPNLQFVKKL